MMRDIPLPHLDALTRACAGSLTDLRLALHLPTALEHAFNDPDSGPPYRLVRLIGNLPDCGGDGGGEPEVLIRRLLRLALVSVRLYQERCAEPQGDVDGHAEWVRRQCAICLGGLVRDLGALWFIDVRAGSQRWPIHRNLVDWSMAVSETDSRIASLQVSTRPVPQDLHAGVLPPNLYFLSRIATIPVIRLLGWQSANDIVRLFGSGGSAPDLGLLVLEEAHLRCATRGATASRPRSRRGTAPDPIGPTSLLPAVVATGASIPPNDDVHRRAGAFMAALRWLMAHPDAPPVNTLDAELFVSASHTILLLSDPPAGRLIDTTIERMRSGMGMVCESGMDPGLLSWLKVEQALSQSSAPTGGPWCHGLTAERSRNIMAVIADAEGPAIRRSACLIFDNQLLWDGRAPDHLPRFPGRLDCLRQGDQGWERDSAQYGFTALALPIASYDLSHAAVPTSTPPPPDGEPSLNALVDTCLDYIRDARRLCRTDRSGGTARSPRVPPHEPPATGLDAPGTPSGAP